MNRPVMSVILLAGLLSGCTTHSQIIKQNHVQLYLKRPADEPVYFACSLDGFRRHPLTRHDKKTWSITLPADQVFTYFYIHEEEAFIPDCQYKEKDDFGSENCVFLPEV
jgi:hypothetical protein